MSVNFRSNINGFSGGIDLDDLFVRREYFVTGNLWLWGYNPNGALGDNSIVNKSSPVQTVAGSTNWKQVAFPRFATAAIKSDGTLWTWGFNNLGQLGDNTETNRSSPAQTVAGGNNWKEVGGSKCVIAIKTDGTLWTWGENTYGQLGTGNTTGRSSPVQTITGGANWKKVALFGGSPSEYVSAIKTDGTLWLWGRNDYGQLGNSTTTDTSSPIQTVAGGTNWKQVACGSFHTAAIKTDGTLWLWGRNTYGALGNNDALFSPVSSPAQTVAGGTNWKQVACGDFHTAAIKTDGTLWNWGENLAGGLGDNTVTSRRSPVQTVSGGTNWKQVSAGQSSTAAIKTDGTLWMWGNGISGQLGDNTTTNKSSPVQTVAGGTNWKQVIGGQSIYAALYS